MTSPMGRATEKFMLQRKLIHEICGLYRQFYPTEWVQAIAEDVKVNITDEVGIREHLIRLDVDTLQEILDEIHEAFADTTEGYEYNRLVEELRYGL